MHLVIYHAARAWSGQARALAVAAAGLAGRGADVTFVCARDSAVERRLRSDLYRVVPLDTRAPWPVVGWRLRRALGVHRLGATLLVDADAAALSAAAAVRLSSGARMVVRVPAGGGLAGSRRTRTARRLAPGRTVYTTDEDRAVADHAAAGIIADLGVDVATYDATRPVARVSIGAGVATRLIACICGAGHRAPAAAVLRTVALLAPRHPELRLVLVGAGSDDDDLRMHAAALGLTRVVGHLGEREDRLAVLRAADMGWVAADGDDAAFAMLDVMALRLPVLAERTPLAAHYVADGISGVLLPRGEAAAMAAAVAPVLANEEARAAIGNAGRARVAREFSETAYVDAIERAVTTAVPDEGP
ncbi:MAG: hypothetical protein NVS1B4_17840 [Gemmatimonadaceae bacterium]